MSQNEVANTVKARLKAIMKADEAQGREALAEHLAFETEMSAEDAVALMNVSPRAEASAAQNEQEYVPPRRMMNADGLNREPGRGAPQPGKGKLAAKMKLRHGIK